MIRKLSRSTVAIAAFGALFLAGACSSTSGDSAVVDDQAEVRPFTEDGNDPTQSAPEVADVNNDGHADSSTLTPRSEGVVGTTVVQNNAGQSSVTVTQYPDSSSSMTSSSSTATSSVSGSTTDSTSRFDTGSTSGTTTTTTTTTTTVPMTSAASDDDDDDDDTAPARERLRKD